MFMQSDDAKRRVWPVGV